MYFLYKFSRPGQNLDMNIVTIYDIQNKFIAFHGPIPQVFGVFCEWGSLYIISADRKASLIEIGLILSNNLYFTNTQFMIISSTNKGESSQIMRI